MLTLGCLVRRLRGAEIRQLARAGDFALHSPTTQARLFSRFPGEYEKYYEACEQPIRRPESFSSETPAAAPAEVNTAEAASPPQQTAEASEQRQTAATVSRWMLPWERRQMDNTAGPLRTWERYYWWVFVGAIALLLFNRLPGSREKDPAELEAEKDKEARRLRAARLMLVGQTFSSEADEDEFEGLSPEEIQAYVDKALGGNASSDPFEGMSPEEINAMLEGSGNQQQANA